MSGYFLCINIASIIVEILLNFVVQSKVKSIKTKC